MKRIDAAGATVDNKFTEGDPGTGTAATDIAADWLNNVQEEICSVIEGSGLALDGTATNQLLLALRRMQFPIGSVYITRRTDLTAFQILGFGTWAKICEGRMPVGLDLGQPEFNAVGATGGSKTHALSTAEMPAHTHQLGSRDSNAENGANHLTEFTANFGYSGSGAGAPVTTSSVGSGNPHNNLPPYEVVGVFWARIA